MAKAYRTGGVGAMMDEYERATADFTALLLRISDDEFEKIRDRETEDEDCRSIQTVARHVARAGFGYSTSIRKAFGIDAVRPEIPLATRRDAVAKIEAMLEHMAATLEGKWNLSDAEINAVEIHASWGVHYDLEQMLEHAIVHVLRHRRQTERFLTDPRFAGKPQPV